MPRAFPRPIESAVRVLKGICDDPAHSTELRARAAELLLSAYGLANLRPDEEPRRRTLKQVVASRLKISALDKEISARVSEDRKQKKLNRKIDGLLSDDKKVPESAVWPPENYYAKSY